MTKLSLIADPKMAIETTRELFNTLRSAGASTEELQRLSGIDFVELEQSEIRYPVKEHLKLWSAGETILGSNAIGITMGSSSDPYNRGIVGLTFTASKNLEEAVQNKIRYTRILADHISLKLIKEEEVFSIIYSIQEGYFDRHEIERVFAGFLNWVRTFVGKNIIPSQVCFQYTSPNNLATYKELFQCPLHFNQSSNSISFDRALFDIENRNYNEYLYSILKSRAETILESLGNNESFIDNIKSMIAGRLNHGSFSVEDIAQSLNMSKRTLHRKLSEEGANYQTILDEIRKQMTLSYLQHQHCDISNLPFLIGYSDARSFNRAFKRWMGCSVTEYKHNH